MSWPGARLSPRLTLGTHHGSWWGKPFVLPPAHVHTHRHVIGTSGMGKSKLLALMAVELIEQGVGVAVIDPHADLASDILALLAARGFFDRPDAYERLWYIDFADPTRHLPFNVLNKRGATSHQIAQELVEVCKRAWSALADGAAPQFENILLASTVVLVDNGLALTDLPRLLTDRDFRNGALSHCADPLVVDFFRLRFDAWGRDTAANIESTLRRAFLLTFSPTLRFSLGQRENRLDFRAIMDTSRSVLFNLGGLDEATQRFLGCLITVGFETASLSRADLPELQRSRYHLVLDEFSQFSSTTEESLARVLSLCRKYGLFLTLAHQTWSQLSARLQGAMQNTVEIAFHLGRSDAEWAAPRFGHFDPQAAKVVGTAAREYPVSVQETFETWTRQLEELSPREAWVAVGKTVTRIRTRSFPATTVPPDRLAALCETYRRRLLVPHAAVGAVVSGPPSPIPVVPPRRIALDD